jgi:hypothetical protein
VLSDAPARVLVVYSPHYAEAADKRRDVL